MRTSIEITDEQRGRLLELAAERGRKGFSFLVQEAIERYLATEGMAERRWKVEAAIEALGSFSEEEADRFEEVRRNLRESWR